MSPKRAIGLEVGGGRYRLERFLAEGGMGEVYQGVERSTGIPVAIKLLKAIHSADHEWCTRFQREATVAVAIDSEHVAKVLGVGKTRDQRRWIAFELLRGESLEQRLSREPRQPLTNVTWLVEHMLRGLAAAHAAGVIHRDIKPGNLFVEEHQQRLKILDFGIAKRLPTDRAVSSALTSFKTLLGTPSYMSPEQFIDPAHVDARTDLYSVGLVVFRMLTGRLPFVHRDPLQVLALKQTERLPSLTSATGFRWAKELDAWLGQMVTWEPEARFGSATAALNAWLVAREAARKCPTEPVSPEDSTYVQTAIDP